MRRNVEKNRTNLNDLVVLQFQENNALIDLVNSRKALKHYPNLSIDLKNGTWTWENYRNIRIGESRPIENFRGSYRYGIIGVYEKTSIGHLNNMIDAVQEEMGKRRKIDMD